MLGYNLNDTIKFNFLKKTYGKMTILFISFLIFGLIYFLFCDDYEFGGINLLQEEINKISLKKIIDKTSKKPEIIKAEVFDELATDISLSGLSKKVGKKITKETKDTTLEKINTEVSLMQKLFNRIYFAIVTGTTLGYGDIYPLSNKVKLLIILQLFVTLNILFY